MCVWIPDVIHNLTIAIITILCVNGVTADKKTTPVMRVLGMLVIFATGKADFVLQAFGWVLVLVVVVVAFCIEPQITKATFFPRISGVRRAQAPWTAGVSAVNLILIIVVVISGRTVWQGIAGVAIARCYWEPRVKWIYAYDVRRRCKLLTAAIRIAIVNVAIVVSVVPVFSTESAVCPHCGWSWTASLTVLGFVRSHWMVMCPQFSTVLAPHCCRSVGKFSWQETWLLWVR